MFIIGWRRKKIAVIRPKELLHSPEKLLNSFYSQSVFSTKKSAVHVFDSKIPQDLIQTTIWGGSAKCSTNLASVEAVNLYTNHEDVVKRLELLKHNIVLQCVVVYCIAIETNCVLLLVNLINNTMMLILKLISSKKGASLIQILSSFSICRLRIVFNYSQLREVHPLHLPHPLPQQKRTWEKKNLT